MNSAQSDAHCNPYVPCVATADRGTAAAASTTRNQRMQIPRPQQQQVLRENQIEFQVCQLPERLSATTPPEQAGKGTARASRKRGFQLPLRKHLQHALNISVIFQQLNSIVFKYLRRRCTVCSTTLGYWLTTSPAPERRNMRQVSSIPVTYKQG